MSGPEKKAPEKAAEPMPPPADPAAARVAELEAKLAAAQAALDARAAGQPAPAGAAVAKVTIRHDALVIEPGAALPFDPSDAEAAAKGGFSGLIEGEHWERVG